MTKNETLFPRLSVKIVKAYSLDDTSIRKVAARFDVSKAFVQKLLKQKQKLGHVKPKKLGGNLKSVLQAHTAQLTKMVKKYPDSTFSEYCEYWLWNYKYYVSPSWMCRKVKKLNLMRKKRQCGVVSVLQNECKS